MSDSVGIFLLALAAMPLEFGVLGEIIQALEFGFVGVVAEWLAVDGDQARNVTVAGFNDDLGGVVALVGPVQDVAEWMMVLRGVQPVLHRAADEGGCIERYGGCGLAERGGVREREQREEQGGTKSRQEHRLG